MLLVYFTTFSPRIQPEMIVGSVQIFGRPALTTNFGLELPPRYLKFSSEIGVSVPVTGVKG